MSITRRKSEERGSGIVLLQREWSTKVASMDWMGVPTRTIAESLRMDTKAVERIRRTKSYRKEWEKAKETWTEDLRRDMDWTRVKGMATAAVAVGMEKLLGMVMSEGTKDSDRLSALKLASELESRWSDGGEVRGPEESKRLADELEAMIRNGN